MTPCSCGPHRHLPATATAPACLDCPCPQFHDPRPALAKPPMPILGHETYRGPNGAFTP